MTAAARAAGGRHLSLDCGAYRHPSRQQERLNSSQRQWRQWRRPAFPPASNRRSSITDPRAANARTRSSKALVRAVRCELVMKWDDGKATILHPSLVIIRTKPMPLLLMWLAAKSKLKKLWHNKALLRCPQTKGLGGATDQAGEREHHPPERHLRSRRPPRGADGRGFVLRRALGR